MLEFKLLIRSFFKKQENNLIKILSLGTGLAVGLIIISKVFFELNYDNFYPDSERIYQIQSNYKIGMEEPKEFGQVSGAVAPGMKAEIPEVESATRLTYLGRDASFHTSDKRNFKGIFILADTCFFDVLPRPMIIGNAKETLKKPMYALVSESVAKKMGDKCVGQTIELDSYPGKTITIGGVFKDLPENSHLLYDIIVSLVSIKEFTWDGSLNWVGNDRYLGYVKLLSGTEVTGLAPAIRQMQERNQPMEEFKKAGVEASYNLLLLSKIHSDTPRTKRMALLLFIIAFSLIFSAVMNYILILISNLVNRGKIIATYKCYGATGTDIGKLIFKETSFHLVLSLIISLLLIFAFRSLAESVLSASIYSLFSLKTSLILVGICLVISLLIGIIPAYWFSRIPVSSAFRSLSVIRSGWKMILLFFQLATTAFLVTLLIIVARQYNRMVNDNPGYEYNNLLYYTTRGVDQAERQKLIDELQTLPQIEIIATSDCLPFNYASGNNILLPNNDQELFNVADLYRIDENYLGLMQIPIEEGKGFNKESLNAKDIVVSRRFADKLVEMTKWTDGVINKEIHVTEHGDCRIIGVYSDIRLGSISRTDPRPSLMFYTNEPAGIILIKIKDLNTHNIQKVYEVVKRMFLDKDNTLSIYKDNMVKLYADSQRFMNAITIGGIVALLITLIGLIGYTGNEVNRRRSEIAIRKVNGAGIKDILRLFVINNLWISFPAIVCGNMVAIIAAAKWMEEFSEKITLTPILFIVCGLFVLIIVLFVVIFNSLYAAMQNPVETLKRD